MFSERRDIMAPFYWLIALAVFLVIEIITLGLTTIWFAGGSLIAFVASLFGAPIVVQIVLFFAISFILLFFTRPIVEQHLNNNREKTNVNSMIGKEGKVTEEIDNFNQKGTIIVNGLEWTARSLEDGIIIPNGSKVVVKDVQGVRAIVSRVSE